MLAGVAEHGYLHTAGREQAAQQHLQAVRRELPAFVPVGMRVLASGAGQSLPVVPWVAVLNPEVTKTAQEGLYVVYLYRRDLARLYLSMNQGATQHLKNATAEGLHPRKAETAAIQELLHESELLRARLSDDALADLTPSLSLGAERYFLPCAYEAGNIGAVDYDLSALPDEQTLQADLTRMLALYASCVDAKNEILADDPGLLKTTASASKIKRPFVPKKPVFRPKSSATYRAKVKAQIQDRRPLHEALVDTFGRWVRHCGFVAATNVHPCDMTVDALNKHWLVEAKTVGPNAEHAVRDAIGQLFAYRHFCYREVGRPDPRLVALFSEPVGDAFVELLTSLGIESIWQAGGIWTGGGPDPAGSLLAATRATAAT
ncbi:hypothetical protein GCM10010174_88500 [Kutzneria viridogrisea]